VTTATHTPTLAELATEAIQIQDACNLSGLSHSLASHVIPSLRQLMPSAGTQVIARHPIVKLWVYKIYSLSWFEPMDERTSRMYADAYEACKDYVRAGK
jgi:hypothetical protein